MPLKESYVIWNNKGGVGKTTLTFHMATQYARRNPTVNVLVIDLCPQANASMALLSSPKKQGNQHLTFLYRKNRTISSYLQRATEGGPLVNARSFLTSVNDYNNQVPANLFLLCGDMKLELVGRHLEHIRSGVVVPRNNPWLNVTSSVRSFIEGSKDKIVGVTEERSGPEWVVFIDTNPSFSVYTEIALAAANKLIIPMNADDFSIEAVRAMLELIYGITPEEEGNDEGEEVEEENFEPYRQYMFSYKARKYNLKLPQIHLLVNNRTTTIFTRSATAFRAMGQENLKVLYEAYQRNQRKINCFAPREVEIADIEAFKTQYFEDIRDFHTTAILSIHSGCPLGAMSGTVSLGEEDSVKVDQSKVQEYLKCLESLAQRL